LAVAAAGAMLLVFASGVNATGVSGSPDRVQLVKSAGAFEVVVTAGSQQSRIVGFGFRSSDRVRVSLDDVDGDGVKDVVVSNWLGASSGRPAAGAPAGTGRASGVQDPAVFTIVTPPGGFAPLVDVGENGAGSVSRSRLGDRDNFGYGLGTGPPPCAFYDNRGRKDLGVFDYELTSGDEVNQWTHTFAVLGTPTQVKIKSWEIFSDGTASTIDLDGHTLQYAKAPFAPCNGYPEGGIKRVQVLTGADAAIASDGQVAVTFSENGDDVSLDRSILMVRFA